MTDPKTEKLEKLTPEDQEKIREWVDNRGLGVCPTCKSSQYGILEKLVQIVAVSEKTYYPTVIIFCTNCFRNTHFSVVPTGIDLTKYGITLNTPDP